jgi:hypothetical protein
MNDVDKHHRFGTREIAFDCDSHIEAVKPLEACPQPEEPGGTADTAIGVRKIAQRQGDCFGD